jgi:hypothetical protein
MPLPFHVACNLPAARLFELGDGRLQLIDRAPIAPFMAGHQYLVVEKPLAEFLAVQALERVQQEPAILFDRITGDEIRTHVRLRVGQFFHADQISDLPLEGPRLLTLNDEYYFVSQELKEKLEGPFPYLRFSEGLGEFG